MAGVDSDRISIASKRSIASVASKFSTLWSKVPRSSRKIPLPLAVICSYIETTPNAQLSPIKELIVYKEEKGVQHEFLLLRLARPTGEDFWVRLERRRSVGTFGNLISSGLEANDMASLSGKRAALLGSTKSVEKTGIIFRDPPSLTDLLRVLEALRESSKFYKVWPENCYFFASVVAEHLYGLDKSAELTGTLRWLNLGADARRRIHQIITSYDHPPVQDHGGELGSISPPGSPAFESPIDELEIENMSSASSTSLVRSLRRSESQMLLSQDAYSSVGLYAQDRAPRETSRGPLRRSASLMLLPRDTFSTSSEIDLHAQDAYHPRERTFSLSEGSTISSGQIDQVDQVVYPRHLREEDILGSIPIRGDKEYTLGAFCTELPRSQAAEGATVSRLLRYGTMGRAVHHFLLLEVTREDRSTFWIRLDRRPRTSFFKILFRGYLAATDMVKMTVFLRNILGPKVQEEAAIRFRSPIPLKRLVKTLDVVRDESIVYDLSRENCWFFASIIQEISVQFLGGRFSDTGRLNNPSWGGGRRRAIKERVYTVLPTRVPPLVTEVESIAAMTHDNLLIEAISQLVQIVKAQDKLLLCSSLDEASRRTGRQSSLIQLLSECKIALYEHLHRLSEVPGARGFRRGFSRDLALRLNSWISSVGGILKISESILDQNQMDKLDTEVTNLFSGAFDTEIAHGVAGTSAAPLQLQWNGQQCSPSADLDLALWTLQHLSYCETLPALFGEHRHRLKEDIPRLAALFDSAVPAKAKFACKSWTLLVCRVTPPGPKVVGALEQVISKWLLYWVVAMGVMNDMDAACGGLHRLEQWMRGYIEMSKLRLHVLNMYRFVLRSKRALSQCPFLVFSTSPSTDSGSSALPSTSLYNAVVITASGNTQESWSRAPLNLQGHPHPVCSLAYSPDGAYLVSAFRDKCVWLWNADTGTKALEVDLPSDCDYVTFSPDGLQVACACENGSIYICNADGSGKPKRLSGHSKRVNSIAYTLYGFRLASASGDSTIRIWDATDGSNIRILEGHTDIVVSVTYSLDGASLASASYDGTVLVWDAASGKQIRQFDVGCLMFCLAFHPDNERVIVACKDCKVRILIIYDNDHLTLEHHLDAVYSVSCSADGNWIVSASADSTISLWHADGTRWAHAGTLAGHIGEVNTVTFSPNGTRVASGSRERSVLIWDMEATIEQGSKGVSFVIASNDRFTVTVDEDNILQLADSSDPDASPVLLNGHADSITCACFSPDGTQLVSASRDESVLIWDIASGQCIIQVGLAEVVTGVSFSQSIFFVPYHISYSQDGLALRVRGWQVSDDSEEPFAIDLSTAMWTELSAPRSDEAFTQTYQPDPTLPIVLRNNCLCTSLENGLAYLCWLPDDFEPISEVIQTGRRVSVGGKGGEVVYVNFDGVDVSQLV